MSSLIALHSGSRKDTKMNILYYIKRVFLIVIIVCKAQSSDSFFLYDCTYITTQTKEDSKLCCKQKDYTSATSLFIDESKQTEIILKKSKSTNLCLLILQGFFFSSTPSMLWGLSYYEIFPEFNICTVNLLGKKQHVTFDEACSKIITAYNYLIAQELEPIVLACCFSSMLITTILTEHMHSLRKMPLSIILDSSLSNFESIRKNIYKTKSNYFLEYLLWLPGGLELCAAWYDPTIFSKKPLDAAKTCSVPTLMFHAEKDFLVPVDDALELYHALDAKKKKIVISTQGNHTSIHKVVPHQYGLICKAWINDLLLT